LPAAVPDPPNDSQRHQQRDHDTETHRPERDAHESAKDRCDCGHTYRRRRPGTEHPDDPADAQGEQQGRPRQHHDDESDQQTGKRADRHETSSGQCLHRMSGSCQTTVTAHGRGVTNPPVPRGVPTCQVMVTQPVPCVVSPPDHLGKDPMDHPRTSCELTIVMPCLNEAETLATCIRKAQGYLERSGVDGEVLIADNGSTATAPRKSPGAWAHAWSTSRPRATATP